MNENTKYKKLGKKYKHVCSEFISTLNLDEQEAHIIRLKNETMRHIYCGPDHWKFNKHSNAHQCKLDFGTSRKAIRENFEIEVEYGYRTDKLFDFSQIEIDKINKDMDAVTKREAPSIFKLNKSFLS